MSIKRFATRKLRNTPIPIEFDMSLTGGDDDGGAQEAKTSFDEVIHEQRRFFLTKTDHILGSSFLNVLRNGRASDPELGERMRILVVIYDTIMAGRPEEEEIVLVEAILSDCVCTFMKDSFRREPAYCVDRIFVDWLAAAQEPVNEMYAANQGDGDYSIAAYDMGVSEPL